MNHTDAKASRIQSFMIKIRIKRNDGSWFATEANKYGTILSLKEIIHEKTGFLPEQQRLVYAGKVMSDEMTLSYYNICENSQVYLVPKKNINTNSIQKQFNSNLLNPKPKPIQLLDRMMALIKKFREISSEEYNTTISEINDIINDPTVQSFSRINEDAKQLLKDAQDIITNSERPISQKTKYFIAKSKDSVLNQFDSTPEGFRILQSLLNEYSDSSRSSSRSCSSLSTSSQSENISKSPFVKSPLNEKDSQNFRSEYANAESETEDDMIFYNNFNSNSHEDNIKTNIQYKPLISTRPLPKLWSDSQYNNEEPVKRAKLTRAPGMSFTLLMQSESSSESDYEIDDEHNDSFKFEPAPSSVNSYSKISPTAIPAVQLPPKENKKDIKRSIFQRVALRMSAPITPNLQTNTKCSTLTNTSLANKEIKDQKDNKSELNSLSTSSHISLIANLISDDLSDSSTKTNFSSSPKIPFREENNDIIKNCSNQNIKIFRKNLSNLTKPPSTKSTNLKIPDLPLNSDDNLQFVKSNNCNYSITLKSKFAEQLNTLKNMGFNDESIILQALSETNGNVKLAAQLLKNKFS